MSISGQAITIRTGPIDEQFFPGLVFLPHDVFLRGFPTIIQIAVAAMRIALGIGVAIVAPDRVQRYAWALQFVIDVGEVERGPLACRRRGWEQPGFQFAVGERTGQRPQ